MHFANQTTGLINDKLSKVSIRRFIALIGLVLVMAIVAQYVSFLHEVERYKSAQSIPKADAVVVFTGDANRIEHGISLFKVNMGKRLLISGVDEHTSRQTIANVFGENRLFNGCCVDLDWQARSTVGNAQSTAAWVKQNEFQKIIIVTSDYHMPRSVILMRREMPDVEIVAAPTDGGNATQSMVSDLLLREFMKYIAVRYTLVPPEAMVTATG